MAVFPKPRVGVPVTPIGSFTSTAKRTVGLLVGREDKDCHPQPDVDLCARPWISSKELTWIIVGVVLYVLGSPFLPMRDMDNETNTTFYSGLILIITVSLLLFFHFRRKRREKSEDMEDRFQMADYGLDEVPPVAAGRKEGTTSSSNGSPVGFGRRSREPLQMGSEPKYPQPGHLHDDHLAPFDDISSQSGDKGSYPPSHNPARSKRESSQPKKATVEDE